MKDGFVYIKDYAAENIFTHEYYQTLKDGASNLIFEKIPGAYQRIKSLVWKKSDKYKEFNEF